MYWVEEKEDEPVSVPDDIVDLAFDIRCQALPVDNAWPLEQAIEAALPWWKGEPRAAVHTIHGAESGNGWYRPEGGDDMLYLSRRTKLVLRLPKERVEEAKALTGQRLDIAGHVMEIAAAKVRRLSTLTSLYARHVVTEGCEDEERFLEWAVSELQGMGITFKKVLSGRGSVVATPDGAVATRSLLVAGLGIEDAIRLQQEGLGSHRKLGCGLFIPHKKV